MPSKFIIGIILINISFSNCSSSGDNKNVGSEELQKICQSFAKAICTKDTVAFYEFVSKADLTTSMNEWMNNGRKVTQDDLFFPFFFVYSPLKIRYEDLMSERNREIFFKDFKVENVETKADTITRVHLEWTENILNAKPAEIELTLKKNNEWKVVGAKWKTL
jgi:hypothetical protein